MTTFDTYPNEVKIAVQSLFKALGTPVSEDIFSIDDINNGANGIHPVFALSEHFRSYDEGNNGYTCNRHRGDHISIPAFTEEMDVAVIDISFHKGTTDFELITFPYGSEEVRSALYELLTELETR